MKIIAVNRLFETYSIDVTTYWIWFYHS